MTDDEWSKMSVVTTKDIRDSGSQPWHLNNTALKSIRDSNEYPRGFPSVEKVDLFETDPFYILTLKKLPKTEYEMMLPWQPWSWRKFLNAFTDDTLEDIVGGGVTEFVCMPIPNSYDHKRWHAAIQERKPYPEDAPVPVWDFVVTRIDGTKKRIHPSLQGKKNCKVSSWDFDYEKSGPKAGKGKSDGQGTFQRMIANTYDGEGTRREGTRAKKSAVAGEVSGANDPGAWSESQSSKADVWRGDASSWESQRGDSTQPPMPTGSADRYQERWDSRWEPDASWWPRADSSSSPWQGRGW